MAGKVTELITTIVHPITTELNLELVDVEFIKEGKDWFLRVYIDKEGGILIEDCEAVSRPLSAKLDEMDPIPQNYYLEVSSPGLDRPLKKARDFDKYKGQMVEIKLFKPIDNKKRYEGELVGFENNIVKIKDKQEKVVEFKFEDISVVKRVINF